MADIAAETAVSTENYKNISYLFIPFSIKDKNDFGDMVKTISESGNWLDVLMETGAPGKADGGEVQTERLNYLYRFVTDKLHPINDEKKCCFHFLLKKESAARHGIFFDADKIYATNPYTYNGEKKVRFQFCFQSIHAYLFSTGVGILAIEISFNDADVYKIAAGQFYIEKVGSPNNVIRLLGEASAEKFTILQKAKDIFEDADSKFGLDFFFYVNPCNERANFLSYVEAPDGTDEKKALFYLKWHYKDDFVYDEALETASVPDYHAAHDRIWGITSSSAVCLALPDRSDKKFLRKTFIGNFKNEYLFMYILLLHQKYVMYLLLTRIGVGMNKDLGALEKYKEDLYDFETNFIFTHITEVPQYQMLYEKIYDAFSLKQMFDDVHDPLLSLEEIKRKTFEDEQKKADENLNMAITSLSYLSIISVFTDTFGLADGFIEWLSSTFEGLGLKCMADCIVSDTASSIFGALGLVGTAAIVAICLYRIKRFSSNKTNDKRSKKDER